MIGHQFENFILDSYHLNPEWILLDNRYYCNFNNCHKKMHITLMSHTYNDDNNKCHDTTFYNGYNHKHCNSNSDNSINRNKLNSARAAMGLT